MAESFIGEIRMVAFNFAPAGWANCDGQLLPIAQNPPLFSLLGTTYGGDGRSTFALPDFRSRTPVHQGQGNGLTQRFLGEMLGEETNELPTQAVEIGQQPNNPTVVNYTPGGRLLDNMQPLLVVNFMISLTGAFPTR
ncbi:MAG TPA: tail fiber protein [Pyrinomonadaceae bacterium]|nr:tail fiber protein [Pyrinomonadaceae bacterium]